MEEMTEKWETFFFEELLLLPFLLYNLEWLPIRDKTRFNLDDDEKGRNKNYDLFSIFLPQDFFGEGLKFSRQSFVHIVHCKIQGAA